MDTKQEKLAVGEDVDLKDHSASSAVIESDPALEARITRKLDAHILPWLFVLWLLAFIDRSNIGKSARITQSISRACANSSLEWQETPNWTAS